MTQNSVHILYKYIAVSFSLVLLLLSCTHNANENAQKSRMTEDISVAIEEENDCLIIDSDLSFEEAIAGTKAPQSVINKLVLFDVNYLSTDAKIHQGQIMTHKKLEADIRHMFEFMLAQGFVVEKVIPAVKYNWSDSLSMADNNSYGFNYRNISYSKHARGMAIDINPRFNPLRWKRVNRPNQPEGAVLDTTVNGTLYPNHPVVNEFKRLGFKWGHVFSKYWDDHHFEK